MNKSTMETEGSEPPVDGRRARGLRRKEAILEVAQELFVEKGYRRTTLADIIAEAGGSRETIYGSFQGKLGLFRAVISGWGGEFEDFVLEPKSLAKPPREFLTELGLRMMTAWMSPRGRALHRTVLSEGVESPELVDAWYSGGSKKVLAALCQYIEHQVELGRIEVEDPMIFARQFQFLLYGELAFPAISGSDEPIDVVVSVERTVDVLLRATLPADDRSTSFDSEQSERR